MSVKPCASWVRRQQNKKIEEMAQANLAMWAAADKVKAEREAQIEAIAQANLAKWRKIEADKARAEGMRQENLSKMARADEALRLARTRLARAEWTEWSSRIGDMARNGRPGYDAETVVQDLRVWDNVAQGRFYSKLDPHHVQPAAMRG
jgi:hypothetical protein